MLIGFGIPVLFGSRPQNSLTVFLLGESLSKIITFFS